jgi:hypothetical protein
MGITTHGAKPRWIDLLAKSRFATCRSEGDLDLNWEHKPTSRTGKPIQAKQSRFASQSKGITGRLEMWSAGVRRGRSFSLLPKSASGWAQRPSVRVAFIGPTPVAHRPFGPTRLGHVSTRRRWRHPIRSSHVGSAVICRTGLGGGLQLQANTGLGWLSRDVAFPPKKAGWFRASETEFLRSGEGVHHGRRAVSSSSGLVYHGHFPEPQGTVLEE